MNSAIKIATSVFRKCFYVCLFLKVELHGIVCVAPARGRKVLGGLEDGRKYVTKCF